MLADAGYASEDNFLRGEQQKLRLLVALRKDPNLHPTQRPRQRATTTPQCEPAAGCVTTAARPTTDCASKTVEPVFGQIKSCQKLSMMSRRGIAACNSEWLLVAAAYNLRKLHVNRLSR